MDTTLENAASHEAAQCPLAIECSPAVLHQLQAEVVDALYSLRHGGAETGGVLYGTYDGQRLRIAAARRLACEHALGPSFTLSPADAERLQGLIAAPLTDRSLAGLVAVGWYHSHTRGELRLHPSDAEIHGRYFREPWQVALLLRPAPMQPTRIAFFVRTGGSLSGPYLEAAIPLAARGARGRRAAAMAEGGEFGLPPAFDPASVPPLDEPPAPPAFQVPTFGMPPPRPPRPSRRKRTWLWIALFAVAVLCLAGETAYVLLLHGGPAAPASVLHLRAVDREGQVTLSWNPASPEVRSARGGTLYISDGAVRRTLPLDPEFLAAGSVTYARSSEAVRFQLSLLRPDGTPLDEYTTLIGAPVQALPSPAVAARTEPPPVEPAAAASPKPTAPIVAAAKPPVATPPRPDPEKSARTAAAKPPLTTPSKPRFVPPPARPAVTLKQFQPPPERRASVPAPPATVKPAGATPAAPASGPLTATAKTPAPPPEPPPAAPAAKPVAPPAPISGQWRFSPSSPSGSPFPPEFVNLTVWEGPSGIQGMLTARYKAPATSGLKPDVRLTFSGTAGGRLRFPWTGADGAAGVIELVRLPNRDSLEVVWYTRDRKLVFDDVLVRAR